MDLTVKCDCGHSFLVTNPDDQNILSRNPFNRLDALFKDHEYGGLWLQPGQLATITFSKPFSLVARTFFTPMGSTAVFAKEAFIQPSQMAVLAGVPGGAAPKPVHIRWSVYGLHDIASVPLWRLQLYSAVSQIESRLFKLAVLEYASCFELFVESFLRGRLAPKLPPPKIDSLLKKNWKIETRVKALLKTATGKSLTDRPDVYTAWDTQVRKPRNNLAHGKPITLEEAGAQAAHSATYDAIRWVQSL